MSDEQSNQAKLRVCTIRSVNLSSGSTVRGTTQRFKVKNRIKDKIKDHCTAGAAKIGPSERERQEKDNKRAGRQLEETKHVYLESSLQPHTGGRG
nr:hypothetical protein [uncultured Noviherbaspirillum sp.]